MAVDQLCRYLATGDGDGLVKVWNISEYCTQMSDEPPVTEMPRKRFNLALFSYYFCKILSRHMSVKCKKLERRVRGVKKV